VNHSLIAISARLLLPTITIAHILLQHVTAVRGVVGLSVSPIATRKDAEQLTELSVTP